MYKRKNSIFLSGIITTALSLSLISCGSSEPDTKSDKSVISTPASESTSNQQEDTAIKKRVIGGLLRETGSIASSQKINKQQTKTESQQEEPQDTEQQEPQTQGNHTLQQDQEQITQSQEKQESPTQHEQQPEQQQEKKTQPTTEKTTQQYIDYSSIDYKLSDIANDDIYYASYAYSQYANSLDKELFGNYSHQTQYGISKSVVSPYIFLMLNYNQDMNKEMFEETASEEEFTKYCDNMNLADYQCFYETNVDFRKYVLDEDFANFLNTISAEYKKYKNGESSKIKEYIDEYFKQNDTNYVRKYFMANTRAMLDRTSGDYFETLDPEVRQEYYDNVVIPLYRQITGNN